MYDGPPRGGTRGGQGEFRQVISRTDTARADPTQMAENYLGHSVNAPQGRWQNKKDIHWYARDAEETDVAKAARERAEEIRVIKEAEEDALAVAMGFAPAVREPRGEGEEGTGANNVPVKKSERQEEIERLEKEEKKREKELKREQKAMKRAEKEIRREERDRIRADRRHTRDRDDRPRDRRYEGTRDSRSRSRDLVKRERSRSRDAVKRERSRSRDPVKRERSRSPVRRSVDRRRAFSYSPDGRRGSVQGERPSEFDRGVQNPNAIQGPNIFPATSYHTGFGALSEKDTSWACSKDGFRGETQIWYTVLEDGSLVLIQLIWSYTGVFIIPAGVQMTFKYYNPKTKRQIWRSLNASGFKPDGRSCKSNEFEVKHTGSPKTEETYTITASLDKTVQISVVFTKPASAPGFKLGPGEEGGYTSIGKEQDPAKRDGFVIHRFFPLGFTSGTFIVDGEIIDAKGDAMFVGAIQGMRPNLIASRWSFAFFTSGGGKEKSKLGDVRAIQMEFETTDDHGPLGSKSGRTKVNLGTVYCSKTDPVPLFVTGQTHVDSAVGADKGTGFPVISDDVSRATQLSPIVDKETGYVVPGGIKFEWESERRDGKGRGGATVTVEKEGAVQGEGGLIEKVDFLKEVPYVLRKTLTAVTGLKPYIYQYHNEATLEVQLGEEVVPVQGWLFNEASFVSE